MNKKIFVRQCGVAGCKENTFDKPDLKFHM